MKTTANHAALSLNTSQAVSRPSIQAKLAIARAKTTGSLLTPPLATASYLRVRPAASGAPAARKKATGLREGLRFLRGSRALVIVLGVDGLSGIPGEWVGVIVGAILASAAFALGYAE